MFKSDLLCIRLSMQSLLVFNTLSTEAFTVFLLSISMGVAGIVIHHFFKQYGVVYRGQLKETSSVGKEMC